jgi:Protein of unknown function (DUF3953)
MKNTHLFDNLLVRNMVNLPLELRINRTEELKKKIEVGGKRMLKITRIILSVITILLAAYGLITGNFRFQPFIIFSLGLLFLVIGLIEFRKGRKSYGWVCIFTFLFSLFVSIQTFLWR